MVLSIVLVLIISCIIVTYIGGSSDKTNSTSDNSDKELIPSFNVNAEQLMQEYTSNEISANDKYQTEMILVSGTIYEVAQDWSGGNYVMLREQYDYNGVQCEFKNKEELMNLYKGQSITLKGKVLGFTKGLVLVDDCSVAA